MIIFKTEGSKMGRKKTEKGFNKYKVIIGLVLLALIVFLIGFDPISWMDMIQLKLLIGGVILIVIILTLRSLYKRDK